MSRYLYRTVHGFCCPHRLAMAALISLPLLCAAGCGNSASEPQAGVVPDYPVDDWYLPGAEPDSIAFVDELQSQPEREVRLADYRLVDLEGKEHRLGDVGQRSHTVVVVLRGYAGMLCMYCTTQTSRLIANYEEFRRRDAEVVVVYPVMVAKDSATFQQLLDSAQTQRDAVEEDVPFPVLLDVELGMVDGLGIRRALSLPATYILDAEGQVRFAYVGQSIADRPSVKALLAELDRLNGGPPASEDRPADDEKPEPEANAPAARQDGTN